MKHKTKGYPESLSKYLFVSFAFTYQQFVQGTVQNFAYTIEVLRIYPAAELMAVFVVKNVLSILRAHY